VVEFDGHRLDVRLKVVLTDAMGFAHEFEVERLWLLVVLDVCTRAVLGYHVVLAPEYSRFDVIKTVERALAPHRARTFTLPGLAYPARGGFPSGVRPELAYACWDWFKLDHAKANLAADALAVLTEFVGCAVDAGPVHTPDDRPYIERFFGTIASCLSHRLPGTTGTNPKDLRRRLADPKGDLRLLLAIEELEDLLEVAIAYYNGRPHSGLNGRSPLETLEVFLRERDFLPRWLPEPRRRTLCLMQTAKGATVRGGLRSGVRPHVNLWGVRHTNATLAASALYLGTRLLIYYTPEDLREVRAFLPDGSELGILKAQGLWGETPHSLRVRQEILRLRRARQLHYAEHANPISAYVEKLRREAKRSRRSATRLAAALALLKEGALPRVPPGPEALRERPTLPPTPTSSSSTPVVQPVARSPAIVPERLDIGTGVVV
jgi:transposase InsO family protein